MSPSSHSHDATTITELHPQQKRGAINVLQSFVSSVCTRSYQQCLSLAGLTARVDASFISSCRPAAMEGGQISVIPSSRGNRHVPYFRFFSILVFDCDGYPCGCCMLYASSGPVELTGPPLQICQVCSAAAVCVHARGGRLELHQTLHASMLPGISLRFSLHFHLSLRLQQRPPTENREDDTTAHRAPRTNMGAAEPPTPYGCVHNSNSSSSSNNKVSAVDPLRST